MKFFILANLLPNLIPNFIKKIEFELNFKVLELEFELEPCDIAPQPPKIILLQQQDYSRLSCQKVRCPMLPIFQSETGCCHN